MVYSNSMQKNDYEIMNKVQLILLLQQEIKIQWVKGVRIVEC